MFYFKS